VLQPFHQKIAMLDVSRKLSGKIRKDRINNVLNEKRKKRGRIVWRRASSCLYLEMREGRRKAWFPV